MLATALEIEPWQLIRTFTTEERKAYEAIEAAYWALHPKSVKFQTKRNGTND